MRVGFELSKIFTLVLIPEYKWSLFILIMKSYYDSESFFEVVVSLLILCGIGKY